jgi:hypothetical protein
VCDLAVPVFNTQTSLEAGILCCGVDCLDFLDTIHRSLLLRVHCIFK